MTNLGAFLKANALDAEAREIRRWGPDEVHRRFLAGTPTDPRSPMFDTPNTPEPEEIHARWCGAPLGAALAILVGIVVWVLAG